MTGLKAKRDHAPQERDIAAAVSPYLRGDWCDLPLITLHLRRAPSPGVHLHLDVCFVQLLLAVDRPLRHDHIPFTADAAVTQETVKAFHGIQAGLAVSYQVLQVDLADRVPLCRA